MGMLVQGRWTDEDRSIRGGAFLRRRSAYDDDLGTETIAALSAPTGRFHLLASLSCPWSHRTLIMRRLKGLADTVPLQIAGGPRVQGYAVNGGHPWPVPGTGRQIRHVHELYALGDPAYTGRASVPLLWDSQARRVASNESTRIMRAFDAAAGPGAHGRITFLPPVHRAAIDALNQRIHADLSNAVYQAGLAQRQTAYDDAVGRVFAMLDELDERLSDRRYLFGPVITETDWRLFATLVRFDAVYHTHFRCTRRRLVDYPSLWRYARDLYAWRGMADLVDFTAIREGYYLNDGDHNPHGIVAAAPDADWRAPHGRESLGCAKVALHSGEIREIVPASLDLGGH